MAKKLQYTNLHRNVGKVFARLEDWAVNPWRRWSLILIILLAAYFVGSAIGMINGVLALMDPVGAFITVVILEVMVRLRTRWIAYKRRAFICQLIDGARFGLLYGLMIEGSKLM